MTAARRARLRAPLLWALGATLCFTLWRLLAGDPVTDGFERRFLDLRFELRGPWEAEALGGVAVVAVDDAAAEVHARAPALRAALARALPKILDEGPSAVALDFLFVDPSPADAALAEAIRGDPRVLVGVSARAAEAAQTVAPELERALDRSAMPVVIGEGAGPPPRPMLMPTPALAGGARLGHVNLVRTADRVVRALPLAVPVHGRRMLPALPLAAFATAEGGDLVLERGRAVEAGGRRIPLDAGGTLVMDHPGPRGTVPTHGLLDVLEGTVPPGSFSGRMVFVGATAESLRDIFATPFGPDIPGVEVLAGVAAGLAKGRWLSRDGTAAALTLALALGAAAAAFASGRPRRDWQALGLGLGAWGTAGAAVQAGFAAQGLWIDATAVLGGLALGSAAGAYARHARADTDAAKLGRERANLARFVHKGLADRLAEGKAAFDGEAHPAAVLFVDAAGFTTLAQRLGPERTAVLLAELHARFDRLAAAHGGLVTDYEGDGALLVFGLVEPGEDDAARALACSEDLVEGAAHEPPRAPDGGAVRLRAAVHFGPVVPALLGGEQRTVISLAGDTVNTAARLLEIAKAERRSLVATREALEAAGRSPADVSFEFLDRTRVRGRTGTVDVWAKAPSEREKGGFHPPYE